MTLQQQYKNQVDRIRRALQQSSKRGFVFDADATLSNIVKKPKRITAATIRRLKKLTAPKIRNQYASGFVDFKTGKTYSKEFGEKFKRFYNRDSLTIAGIVDAGDVIIINFVNHVGQWVIYKKGGKGTRDYSMRDYAMSWLSGMIGRYGKAVVANGLQAANEAGEWVDTSQVYAIGVETAIARIASYIGLPKAETDRLTNMTDDYSGEYMDLEEYTRDNVYYSDLYTF